MNTLVGHEYLWSCGAEREVEILSRSGKKCTTGLAYWCSWAAWAPTEQPRLNLNHAPWFRSKDRSTFWFPHVDHTVDGQRKYRVVYLPLALCPLYRASYSSLRMKCSDYIRAPHQIRMVVDRFEQIQGVTSHSNISYVDV